MTAKPYVVDAQARAVQEHLARTGQAAQAKTQHSASHIVVERSVPEREPKVSLIIPSCEAGVPEIHALETVVEMTSYRNFEVIVLYNRQAEMDLTPYTERFTGKPGVIFVPVDCSLNSSALHNHGVTHASGEFVGFLDSKATFTDPAWLGKMVAQAVRAEVGVVGARILSADGRIQHAGILLGVGGVAGNSHRGRSRWDGGYFNRAIMSQNVSAVSSACLLLRRAVFERVRGFDEQLSSDLLDVDLCLRVREAGLQIVYEPAAEIYLRAGDELPREKGVEYDSRRQGDIESLRNRWGISLKTDPYYNPNLTCLSEDFALAFPPRVVRSWAYRRAA